MNMTGLQIKEKGFRSSWWDMSKYSGQQKELLVGWKWKEISLWDDVWIGSQSLS